MSDGPTESTADTSADPSYVVLRLELPVAAPGAGAGHWKLKAKHDDGRIELEFEVDVNRAGQRWAVRVTDNGTRVVSRTARTTAPSGSFSVEKKIKNRAGTDTIRARAVRGDRICAGVVRV